MDKSCSLAMLCFDCVEGDITGTGLEKFEFVFLIELRYVSSNIPLEDVIMKQHGRLEAMKVSKEQIRAILEKSKTLQRHRQRHHKHSGELLYHCDMPSWRIHGEGSLRPA